MTKQIRAQMFDLMRETVADRAHWVYSFYRPLYVPRTWKKGQTVHADCSKGVQYICRWGGVHDDPMGMGYGPWGNSSTLAAHLPHRQRLGDMEIGDIVTFGALGSEHATAVYERVYDDNGKVVDLVLWSHGHQGAPDFYRLSQDRREHQLLHLPVAGLKKQPLLALRDRTGFWSWHQWNRGRGDWQPYGRRYVAARPNVPKRIPLAWWVRDRRLWLALREKRGNKPKGPGPLA